MNLVQLNVDVDPDTKKQVRKDSIEFEVNHAVIAATIFDEFFNRYPNQRKRGELYRKTKEKLEKALAANGNGARAEILTAT